MKKLILLLMATLTLGCATTNNTPAEDPYKHITVEKVSKHCPPTNVWNVGVLGNPAMVATFENCLEVESLLLIVGPVIEESVDLSTAVVTVVRLSYVNYLNESATDLTYTLVTLKETYKLNEDKENTRSHVSFYSIESTKKTK